MKTTHSHRRLHHVFLAAFLGGLGLVHTHAQFNFDCGSRGTEPLNVTADTNIALPPDGVLHYTTITVASGAKLTFTPNDLNTPVYLLAKGDVVIDGTIDVSGAAGTPVLGGVGGPGGFAGGNGGNQELLPGDGHGPGGGKGGNQGGSGAYNVDTLGDNGHGTAYGSPLLVPLVGGSGGGASYSGGGGGGGGAILVASNTRILLGGGIAAKGGNGSPYGTYTVGSGGAIRLLTPVIEAGGFLDVTGGQILGYYTFAGGGRIRIDCMDRRSLTPQFLPSSSVASIGANMIVFPPNAPRLDITAVGANTIPVPANSPVFFMLPQDSNTNQTVRVRATEFKRVVPIRVVLTPDNGPSSSYDAEIDNSAAGSAEIEVQVVVPVNVQVHVNAWTR